MLIAAGMLVAALSSRLSVVHDLQAGRFDNVLQRAADSDDFVSGTAAFYGLTQVVIVVLFIIWMYRAAKNNEALERQHPRFGPGWSIGAWFIPLANLVIPVMIMQDLWRGASPEVLRGDPTWRRSKGCWLIGAWWAVLLVSLLRFAPSNGPENDSSLGDIESNTKIAIVGVVAAAIAAVLAALVVWTLSRRQLDALRVQRTTYDAAVSGRPDPAGA
jgi:hypothetical protein